MRAIEVRGGIGSPRLERVVSVEEETCTQSAPFIERVRIGVGGIHHQAMGHSLCSLQLQGVVSGNTLGSPEIGIGIKPGVRSAESGIAVREGEGSDGSLDLLGEQRARGIVATARR